QGARGPPPRPRPRQRDRPAAAGRRQPARRNRRLRGGRRTRSTAGGEQGTNGRGKTHLEAPPPTTFTLTRKPRRIRFTSPQLRPHLLHASVRRCSSPSSCSRRPPAKLPRRKNPPKRS